MAEKENNNKMNFQNRRKHGERMFSSWILALMWVCLFTNVILSYIATTTESPLFFDNLGTVITGALAGPIPGMIVGFMTNMVKSITNTTSMYFGIFSALIALYASMLSKKRAFKHIKGCIMAIIGFALIGGAAGSCVSWFLYGGGLGTGLAAEVAGNFVNLGMSAFWAHISADFLIDCIDKSITVVIAALILNNYSPKMYDVFPLSYLYDRNEEEIAKVENERKTYYRKNSIDTWIILLIIVTASMISIVSISVNSISYRDEMKKQYILLAENTATIVANGIDSTVIDDFIINGDKSLKYESTENKILKMCEGIEGVEHTYVCGVEEEGFRIIFDFHDDEHGKQCYGTLMEYDKEIKEYTYQIMDGEELDTIEIKKNGTWYMTAYVPIKNANEEVVAYAMAEISMQGLAYNESAIIVRTIALLFGITMLIVAFSIWFARIKIVEPINAMVKQSKEFDKIGPEDWLESEEWKNKTAIASGDELETLYNTISQVQENVAINVNRLKETELKLRESKELEKKNKELAEAIRKADEANAAKSEFLSRMSHDLRTPLNGIIGIAELSDDELNDIEEAREYFKDIKGSGKFMLELINDILDMAKIESGKIDLQPERFEPAEIRNSIDVMFRNMCRDRGINLEIKPTGKQCAVMADKMRLQQVIFNLMSNAVKFTPKGGCVEYISEATEVEDDKLQLKIIIRDNGIGMSEEYQKHMYESFSQEESGTKSTVQGSGLGLAIAKSLVELMDGTIECVSEQNVGTQFTMLFKFKIVQEEVKAEDKIVVDNAVFKNKRMLVCEDNPLNMKIATKMLEKKEIIVECAENGKEGVEKFKNSKEGYYDMILMDIRMPEMDGLEATRVIRSLDRKDAATIPIIAMTANAFDEDVKASIDAGMTEHFAKPLDFQKLFQSLARYL